MTIFLTIVSGVIVFVLGQAILKLVIEPVQEAKETLSKIQIDQTLVGHIAHNSEQFEKDDLDTVFKIYREHSGRLVSLTRKIPFYDFVAKVTGLPPAVKMLDASRNLIRLSNWINSASEVKFGHIVNNTQELIDNLGLYMHQDDRIDENLVRELMTPKRDD